MATSTRICKVCGKEYPYCKTWLGVNKFRYQDVACSPKCGAEYFAIIAASRSENKESTTEEVAETPTKKITKRVSKKASTQEPVKEVEVEAEEGKTEEASE